MTNSADLDYIRLNGFFKSQLIWIYTVCKGRAYAGSAGPGLIDRNFRYFGIVRVHVSLINNLKLDETKHLKVYTLLCPGVKSRTQDGVHFIADFYIVQIKTHLRCQEHTSYLTMEQVLAKMGENNQHCFLQSKNSWMNDI